MSLERQLKRKRMLEQRKAYRKWLKRKQAAPAIVAVKPVVPSKAPVAPEIEVVVAAPVLEQLNAVLDK